jgi:hypothetical protein
MILQRIECNVEAITLNFLIEDQSANESLILFRNQHIHKFICSLHGEHMTYIQAKKHIIDA